MTWVHHTILGLFFFTLGACIGSFLNVCIYRIPRRLSLVRPRSRCPKCLTEISPRDNLPILGWMLLRGRCRRCDLPISARYPAVEALVGSLFVACYLVDTTWAVNDLLDRGATLVFTKLILEDLLMAVLVAAAFIAYDERKSGRSVGIRSGKGRPYAERKATMANSAGFSSANACPALAPSGAAGQHATPTHP